MTHFVTFIILFYFVAVSEVVAGGSNNDTWHDDFSVVGPAGNRYRPAWQDIPYGVGRYLSPDDGWKRYESLIADQFTEGTIEVSTGMVKPIQLDDDHDAFSCTGLVIKSNDEERLLLRVGAYDQIHLEGMVGGKPFPQISKPFKLEPDKYYRIKAELKNRSVKVWVNDVQYFNEPCAISTEPGNTGLYAESPVWFDSYRVTGVVSRKPVIAPLTGEPRLETVYARFRADLPFKREVISTHGAIDLYLQNTGTGPAQLKSVELNGKPIEYSNQDTPFAWYEQRPWRIEPGETGLIILRVRGLPGSMGRTVMDNPESKPVFYLTAHWEGGVSKSFDVPFEGNVDPFQINFLSFSDDLKTLYVYVQNNDWIHRDRKQPINIQRVLVGGKDMTRSATIGDHEIKGRPVPIAVRMNDPLPVRRYVSVVVESDRGPAGHTLRAIPSRTMMQVCVFAEWTGTEVIIGPRVDYLEDLDNHCINAVSIVGKKFDHLPRVKELGMYTGGYGSYVSGYCGWMASCQKPGNPAIVSCWMDEVDKATPFDLYEPYQAMFRALREKGQRPPFHSSNVMIVHTPGAMDYMEMSDGIIHAYGLAENYGHHFGRFEDMEYREHRMSRRPFHPYLRNSEVYAKYVPEEDMVSKLSDQYPRCMTPDEQRWQHYGLLLQGAKGVQHWGYGNIRDSGYGGQFRLGLGGAGAGRTWEHAIHPRIVNMLQETWDEVGRLNAEWRSIGHLIGISDVSDHARVTSSEPALNKEGKPAAAASALLAGTDAMVVVILNHNMDMVRTSQKETSTFHPTKVVTDVAIPKWLKPVDIFRVSHEGLTDVRAERPDKKTLRFSNTLNVNDLIVITGKKGMKKEIATRLADLREKLQRAYTSKPIHTTRSSPYLNR